MIDPQEFVNAIQGEINDPSSVIRIFDELMSVYDLLDNKHEVLSIKADSTVMPTSFDISLKNQADAKELKDNIDSYIEISKYNHQYSIATMLHDSDIQIQLYEKASS